MARSQTDFAHPLVKTAGCLVVLISGFPLLCVVHAASSRPIPDWAFCTSALFSLAGLGALCGQPSQIGLVIRSIRDALCAWARHHRPK